jgi:hypothetical protein
MIINVKHVANNRGRDVEYALDVTFVVVVAGVAFGVV